MTRLALVLALLMPCALLAAGELVYADPAWTGKAVSGAAVHAFDQMRPDGRRPTRAGVRVVEDNVEAWWTRWWLLNSATRSIDLTYFIVKGDAFGKSLLGLLQAKAREGVKIRFMVDSRGSKDLGSVFWGRGLLKELSKLPNVDVRVFNPLSKAILRLPKDLRQAMASNHDKLVIVDDEWVLTGGRNIATEYFADPRDIPDVFSDTDILMHSAEVARRARQAFDEEFEVLKNDAVEVDIPAWNFRAYRLELSRQIMHRWLTHGDFYPEESIGHKLRPLARELHEELDRMRRLVGYDRFDPMPRWREVPVTLLDKHSRAQDDRNDITPNLIRLIDAAEHHVILQNPYVILTKALGRALVRASQRGVALTIHTNGPTSTDHLITQAFFLRDWKKMMRDMPTLRLFAAPGPERVHSKVMLVDDRVSVIGTYNLDPMSQTINSEVVAVVQDEDFTREQRLRIAKDLAQAIEYKVRVLPNGQVEKIRGPEDELKGLSGFLTRVLSKLDFLKKLV